MEFNSFTYILFLFLSVGSYWSIKNNRYKQFLLLFLSLIFYGFWRYEYIFLLLGVTLFNFYIGKQIYKYSSDSSIKKKILIFGIIVNLSILFFYKYIDFMILNINGFSSLLGLDVSLSYVNILLPIGISFYTFQAMSYIVDVYRDEKNYIKDVLLYTNYIVFWPQMIAGPIIRASEIIFQFQENKKFKIYFIIRGLFYIYSGLLLKLIMADNIAPYIETGFDTNVNYLTFFDAWTLSFAFGIQIYFDFAGYSMIAIGSAYLFGFSLPKNFFFPYMSLNIRDFWKRWHITLSAWIRDYLYIPLTGQKFSADKSTSGIEIHNGNENVALFATWSIMGLWHGASWGYLLWGVYQALLIFFYRIFKNNTKFKLPQVVAWFITILFVMAGWIFFRADNISDALTMYALMFNIFNIDFHLGLKENFYLVTFAYVVILILSYKAYQVKDYIVNNKYLYYIFMYLFFTIGSFLIFVEMKQVEQFIYFQF